ncbi:MAG: helix-turn-helix transcriptional regulator [Firmicutes bacterium]|nr:helix-turn-helix transcriptional regulator [Bacillota bacterium]MBQ6260312.1 helix-turn-helix transcriptional regulator [Bacillota bacterium]MBR0440849.1 helix-turn-helix transcriptional regulator [Bacillota bacterium]
MDKYRLEYERKRKGMTTEQFCEAIDMSRSAYYRKCNGSSEFTQKEIETICRILDLKSPMGIFFTEVVS